MGKVFVFIEAANLEQSAKSLGWWVDYKRLYRYFRDNMELGSIRFYCARFGAAGQNKFFIVLKRIGFKLVSKPIKIIKDKGKVVERKANFDVEIALDAFLLLDRYSTLFLFSGDSDFDYLVRLLRARGKRVIVVSTKYHISKELVGSCDKYINLKKLRPYFERFKKKRPSFSTGG